MLSAGGWESISSLAESTPETAPRSDPTVLYTPVTGTYLQFLIMWLLKGWDKPDAKKQYRDSASCVLPQALPWTLSWGLDTALG